MHSHLATLKKSTHKIIHDGIPLDDFESDYLREASYSWNPPIQDTLMAVNENDIDDHFDFDDSIELSQHDVSFEGADPDVRSGTNNPADEFIRVLGDAPDRGDADLLTANDNDNLAIDPADEFIQVNSTNLTVHPVKEIFKGAGKTLNTLVPTGISKITELTLDQFENNYKLFAQKLADVDTDLVIRAILLKNNDVVFNYSFKIQGTDNLQNATISAANKVCNLLLGRVLKGDTLVCSLRACTYPTLLTP